MGEKEPTFWGWGNSEFRKGWGPRPVGLALDFREGASSSET